jgi:hypothetical protein
MDSKTVNIDLRTEEDLSTEYQQDISDEKAIEEIEASQYKEKVEQYIKLISSADTALIDYEYIYNRGHYYIKLYKQDYIPYLEKLEKLTTKYYNSKKYTFNTTNKVFEVINLKDNSSVTKLDKTNTKNVVDYLYKARNQIQRERNRLLDKYNSYLTDKNLNEGQIRGFNKKRTYLINKLNEYYAIEYYYNRINLINNNFILSTQSELREGKLEYSLKYLREDKYEKLINNNIELRNRFITAKVEDDDKVIKDYIKNKLKVDKRENKKRKHIDIIILNKDIILHKFIFNSSNNSSNKL